MHTHVCISMCTLYICSFTLLVSKHCLLIALVSSWCVCVLVWVCVVKCWVTGNLKCECLVSLQHDDFLCQQTVSQKIDVYYDEINLTVKDSRSFQQSHRRLGHSMTLFLLRTSLLFQSLQAHCLQDHKYYILKCFMTD